MKEIIKSGLSLFVKLIIVNIMCFFVVLSLSVLSTAAFSKNIGYKAYGTTSDSSEQTELYSYYYKDGEDTKKESFEKDGYSITQSKIRSEISKSGNTTFLIVSQIFCTLILIAFVYPNNWQTGTKDSNLVKFKHKKEDKLKGLKIGIVCIIPSLIVLTIILIFKIFNIWTYPTVLYKFTHSIFYSFLDVLFKSTTTIYDVSYWKFIILYAIQFIIPLISWIGYLLGYNNYSISEKLIYKKNKNN